MKLVDNMIDVTRFDSGYLNMSSRNVNENLITRCLKT